MKEIKKKLVIGQDNVFLQKALYKDLNIKDLKVFKTIVSKINYKNSLFEDFYTIDYDDLDIAGVEPIHRFNEVTKALKRLSSCFVKIRNNDDDIVELGLISNKFIYKKHTSKIVVHVHEDLKPYLLDLKNKYTRYSLENIQSFDSLYVLQIFELCKSWEAVGKHETSVKNLRDFLGLKENQYRLYGNFKQRILQHALNVINETTDIIITIEEKKKGKSVVGIVFYIDNKILDDEDTDITKLIDKVFIDNKSKKYLIMGYEQEEKKDSFRFKVFAIASQKITYTEYMKKDKLYHSMMKMIRETEMIKRIGIK